MGKGKIYLRWKKNWLLFPLDLLCVESTLLLSFELRFNWNIPQEYHHLVLLLALLCPVIFGVAFFAFKLYRRMWKYANIDDLVALIFASLCGTCLLEVCSLLNSAVSIPLSVLAPYGLMVTAFAIAVRLLWRIPTRGHISPQTVQHQSARLLIYGAGAAGALAAREIQSDASQRWKLVGFIDDDEGKHGQILYGVHIIGGSESLADIISDNKIDQILVAIPSLSRVQLRAMVDELNDYKLPILIVPPFVRWMEDLDLFTQVRPVQVEDLLGRDPLPQDISGIGEYLNGRTVLVTGAGGSIGSEICRQVAALNPKLMVLLGRGENSIFEIHRELKSNFPDTNLDFVIGDIRDRKKMSETFRQYKPEIVFHAAAHKHVPLMESNPDEAYINNIVATRNLADIADQYDVERFIFVSSDKAVRPTSVMGSSKRVAEMLLQSRTANQASKPRTSFLIVRFGNVLGSRGSVIRVFREQIAQGGPVTVTDERMQRYFMTIPEAVRLVVEAGAVGEGGDVLLFDMGESVKILDLAERMIRLSGLEPGVDIPIDITGIRPGEKLFEELSRDSDSVVIHGHDRIWRVKCPVLPENELQRELDRLEELYQSSRYVELAEAIKQLAWWEPSVLEPGVLHNVSKAAVLGTMGAKA